MTGTADAWPIALADVRAAERRVRPILAPTPFRNYPTLDAAVGAGIEVWVKHENFGRRVGIVLSGGNIDAETLRRVVPGAL
jgi:threonine dehydratase